MLLVKRVAKSITIPPTAMMDGDGAHANAGMHDPMAGPFIEKDSKSEIPRLSVTNGTGFALHLLLKDRTGKLFHVDAGPFETANASIPAGEYDLAITGDSPAIHGNSGDAIFRRYKEYSATFVVSFGDNGPIHIGD
jgi:hypothetical protein